MKATKLNSSARSRGFLLIAAVLISGCLAAVPIVINITIDVAPNVLNLQNKGTVVTVHTDVAYSLVAATSVYLNGVLIQSWKADDRGNFVAKFNMEAIKDLPLVINGYNTLTLTGYLTTGEQITGSQQIKVVNNLPKK